MCRAGFAFVWGLALVFLCPLMSIAQTKSFDLTSYRPTGYHDWRWPIRGLADWSGYSNTAILGLNQYSVRETIDDDYSSHQFELATYPRYEYQGPESWVIGSATLQGLSLRQEQTSTTETERYGTNPDDVLSRTVSSQKQTYGWREVWLGTRLDAGRYVTGEWFVSLSGSFSNDYLEDPDRVREERQIATGENYDFVDESLDRNKEAIYRHALSLSVMFQPGYGRIYDGSFAYTAIAMVDELRRSGQLLVEPSFDQMMGLTEVIFRRRQTHAIDGRMHRIESLTAIADYLKTAGIVGELGARDLASLGDIWDYFPRAQTIGAPGGAYALEDFAFYGHTYGINRDFGWQVRGGIGVIYSRSSQFSSTNYFNWYTYGGDTSTYDWTRQYYTRSSSRRLAVTLSTLYHRPVTMRWQLDAAVGGLVSIDPTTKDTSWARYFSTPTDEPSSQYVVRDYSQSRYAWVEASLGYFFNGRTNLTGGIQYTRGTDKYSYRLLRSDSYETEEDNHRRTRDWYELALSANLVYRIQVPTTLAVGCAYNRPGALPLSPESWESREGDNYEVRLLVSHNIF